MDRGVKINRGFMEGEGAHDWLGIEKCARILGHTRVAAEKCLMDRVATGECRIRFFFGEVWFNRFDVIVIEASIEERRKNIMATPEFAEAMSYNWDER